jgi:hypothetical protein
MALSPFVHCIFISKITGRSSLLAPITDLTNNVPSAKPNELGGKVTQHFDYDGLHRLTHASGAWKYDPNKSDEYVPFEALKLILQEHPNLRPTPVRSRMAMLALWITSPSNWTCE